MSDMLIRDKSYDLFCAAGGPEEGPPAVFLLKKAGALSCAPAFEVFLRFTCLLCSGLIEFRPIISALLQLRRGAGGTVCAAMTAEQRFAAGSAAALSALATISAIVALSALVMIFAAVLPAPAMISAIGAIDATSAASAPAAAVASAFVMFAPFHDGNDGEDGCREDDRCKHEGDDKPRSRQGSKERVCRALIEYSARK